MGVWWKRGSAPKIHVMEGPGLNKAEREIQNKRGKDG